MNKLFTKIAALALGMTMATGVGVAVASSGKEASPVRAAASWTRITAVNDLVSGTYIMGYESTAGSGTIIPLRSDGANATTSANGYFYTGTTAGSGTSGTININTISDTSAYEVTITKISNGVINIQMSSGNYYGASSGGGSKNTGRLYTSGNSNETNLTVAYSSNKFSMTAGVSGQYKYMKYNTGSPRYAFYNSSAYDTSFYIKTVTKTAATINGANSVDVGNQWSPTSITEDVSGNTVTGATYSFAASDGATISSSSTANGTFTCSSAGTVVVSATKTGYEIASKTVTVNSSDPYINLTLTSGADAYTGQTVNITSEYGNGVTGLTWTVQSGTVSDVTSSNSGYSAKIGGSTGTLTIRATDTGSALYKEVSVSVTKVTLTLNKNSTTIRQGKSETLVATHNASSVGGVNWTSDNAKVTVGATTGVVTVASDATVDSTATITATSAVDSSVSATCVVTVAEQPLVYEIAFGSTKNTNPTELTTSTFLSVFSVDSNVSCSHITKMYATDNTNNLKVGSGSYAGSVTLSIPSNQYFVGVEAVIAYGANLNLQVQSGASSSTLEAQNVTSAGTYTFDDYLSSEESNTVTISTSKSGAIYLTELNLYYAVKTPTITVDPASHSIRTNETAVSTVTIANFASTPTLEYNIQSGSSSISTVVIGAISNNQATVTITPSSTAGTAVVRIRDHANPSSYYADITVVVSEVPSYYMVLDAYTDTGTDYGYKGGVIEIDVTDSHLAGDIEWEVTSGSVTGASSDNDGFMATISSVGTLTIVATDDGDNTNTETVTITVVDSLNAVMASAETAHASTLTFTKACDGSGTADDGATWTVDSDAPESNFDSTRGIHYGTNSSQMVQYVELVSLNAGSGANNTIKSVVVNASDAAGSGSLTVTVGSSTFHHGSDTSVTVTNSNPGVDYTFTGSATGTITVRIDRGSEAYKAIYVKSIVVNYVTAGAESDIANAVGMHLAQKAVIDYAKDFNDTLEAICVAYGSTDTSDLEDAWSDLETQYTNWFTNSGKSLTDDEKAHAKLLFANASSVDRNVTASADELQHMLAKYDWIVGHYSNCLDFLNTDPGTGRDPVAQASGRTVLNTIMQDSNTVAIIVIISVISVSAVGGYFFLRKRKEN